MLIYVTRSGEMSLKSHFGKQLLRKWSRNEKFSIQFILIQLCGIFQKCTNCLFELQMHFHKRVTHATELCDIYHFKGIFV